MSCLILSYTEKAIKERNPKIMIEHAGEILEISMDIREGLLKMKFDAPMTFRVVRDNAKIKEPKEDVVA